MATIFEINSNNLIDEHKLFIDGKMLKFTNINNDIAETWKNIPEKTSSKNWQEIDTILSHSNVGSEPSQKIAIKVTNINNKRRIKIEWLPYLYDSDLDSLMHEPATTNIYILSKEVYDSAVHNRNNGDIGLGARLAKYSSGWVLYLMVYTNNPNVIDRSVNPIIFTGPDDAGGGNSGVRIPPLE
jgi:hypothetical protein